MDAEAIILALLRGTHVIALASLFGTLVSLALVVPTNTPASARQRLVVLARRSTTLALLIGVCWLVLQSVEIAGATSLGDALHALLLVVRDTQFGHLVLIRFALLLGTLPLLNGQGWRLAGALVLTGAALAMQGAMGHAGATGGAAGAMLLVSEALHLLAAGAWLGGLLPLFILVGALPPRAASTAAHAFSPIGLSAVLLLAGTALVQAWELIGSLPGLFGTAYGHIALSKLGLFFLLLALACINRFFFTDRLRAADDGAIRGLMRTSILIEAMLGALVIVVAAFLASGTPATHEAPIWPFARQPSLELVFDPFGRTLLLQALWPSLIAAAAVLAGWFWRPILWPAIAALVVCLGLAWPDLTQLLSTSAHPTTFVTSPTEFADSSIVHGQAVFRANCTVCHGAEAQGNGPAAKTLPIPPSDLTAPHFWGHTEGDLYWFISHGINAPSGKPAMPAFGTVLSSDTRWALIDFLKAHNAGWSMHTTGRWNHPIELPQFDADCADGSAIDRDDLHGRLVRIIAATDGMPHLATLPKNLDVTTIVLSAPGHPIKPSGAACASVETATWDAFAILLGLAPDALGGTQAVADANGWLRLRWQPGDAGDWNDPAKLATVLQDVAANPLAVAAGGGHAHHH
ncbi:MAG TPA: CopD family protein [Acetobacteraceae bacterium]|jgi:putative copper export protein/mono/diheme cytochrome c family protein